VRHEQRSILKKPSFYPGRPHPDRDSTWYEVQKADILHRTAALDELHEQYPATDAAHRTPRSVGLIVLRTDCPRVFVQTLCLTTQGLDGDPVYLLDEFMCYRFKLFQEGGGFLKLCAGR
jgi:hypothetical protein